MKYILVSLFLFSFVIAAPQDEIEVLEELIHVTKTNLEGQESLLKKMGEFKKAREAFLIDPESGKLATALVKRAMQLQLLLEREHLSHLFSSDFLTELAFYNQVGKQLGR
jgi:hypothetical protein